MKLVLALILAINGAQVHGQELKLKPTASVACDTLLSVKAALATRGPDLFFHGTPVLHVGTYRELRKLTLASGMERAAAIQGIALAERILEKARGQVSILGSVARYVERFQRDGNSLLVCVTEGDCQLVTGTMFIPDESQVAVGLNAEVQRPQLDTRIPHVILLNGGTTPLAQQGVGRLPSRFIALGWATDLLSGATSFATFALLSEWIDANTKLLQAGVPADEMFLRHVRVTPRGFVETGFFRVLASSRIIAATEAIAPDGVGEVRRAAMMEIESAWQDTRAIVEAYNLREDNIYEFGQRVSREMLATIRRASGIRAN